MIEQARRSLISNTVRRWATPWRIAAGPTIFLPGARSTRPCPAWHPPGAASGGSTQVVDGTTILSLPGNTPIVVGSNSLAHGMFA